VTNTIPLSVWLEVVESEYLDSFIRDGGASIKFVVPMGPDLALTVDSEFASRGNRLNYVVAQVNASETKVHMPQEIFFRVAEQINWRDLARRVIIGLSAKRGYRVEGIDRCSGDSVLGLIARANDLDESFVLRELRPGLQDEVFRNTRLAKDFRVAMTHLCQAETMSSGDNYEGAPLVDWLTGTNRRVSSVRHYSIYNSINRTNARHMFESLLHWLRYVGFSGLVILFDVTRVTVLRNPRDGLLFYSRSSAMDHYELLREFIDATDRLEGCFMVVRADTDFLDEQGTGKGYGMYQALMSRIIDEVRDRTLVNPMSSLIRLTDSVVKQV